MAYQYVCKCGVVSDQRRCPKHRRKDKRPSPAKRGYGPRWARFSKNFLEDNPLCIECGASSQHTDHIDGKGPNGPRGFDRANCRPLCASCHSRRSAEDQPGGFNARTHTD